MPPCHMPTPSTALRPLRDSPGRAGAARRRRARRARRSRFRPAAVLAERRERLVTSRSCSTSSGRALWWRSTTSPRRSATCANCSAPSVIATVPGRRLPFVGRAQRGSRSTAADPRIAPHTTTCRTAHALHRPRGGARRSGAPRAAVAAADADRHRRLRQDEPGAAVRATAARRVCRRRLVRRLGAAEGGRRVSSPRVRRCWACAKRVTRR